MAPSYPATLPHPEPPPAAPAPLRLAVVWLTLAGFFALMAVADATQTKASMDVWEPAISTWPEVTRRTAPYWALWVAFTPLVVWLAGRLRPERGTLARALPVHLAAALLLAFAHSVLSNEIAWWLGWPRQYAHTEASMLHKAVISKTHLNLLTYAAIAGVFLAFDYHRRFRERELLASTLQARLSEAHLHALRTQLQPHFLFNTLNAVSVLALKGETQCAIRMLSRLSDLLRLTLESTAAQEVPLRDELAALETYLEIERVRFHDRLTVHTEVESEALDAAVPQLLTQPLVENAIRHGIAHLTGAGRIEVRARRAGAALRLEVRDTGPGLPADGPVREGIGLSNTRARLASLYGGEARFELRGAPGGGALVVVEIPFRPLEAHAAAPRRVSDAVLEGAVR